MKIGICDDEPIVVKILLQLVERSIEKSNIKAEVLTFLSGCSLIEKVEELDAVFLDIEMPELDGYEVGRVIKKRNPSCKIIMATGKVERFKESYQINAFRFVTKPFDYNEIEEAIEALKKMKLGEEVIMLYYNRIQTNIPQKKIKYFKAYNGYTEAIIEEKCYRKDISLNELEALLDNRLFARIHKQYIVNLYFVESYKNTIVVINGECIPISRRKLKGFEKKYIEFDVNYRG